MEKVAIKNIKDMNPKRKFIGHVVNGGPVTIEEGIKAGIIKNPVLSIPDRIKNLEMELETTRHKYSGLCQIDMLSAEGYNLDARINNLKGQIEALKSLL